MARQLGALSAKNMSNALRCDQVAGFILAGGSSSRMRRDKALLEIAGQPMLLRAARLLEPLVAAVAVVGPPERYAHLGLRVVPDEFPGAGPLGGLATAVRISSCPWNLVVACDLPYLSAEWLNWLMARALASPADAVLPASARGLEPLCAMYASRCARPLAAALARGVRKVADALAELSLEKIAEAEWKAFDSVGRLLHNVNTPQDYAEARESLEDKSAERARRRTQASFRRSSPA